MTEKLLGGSEQAAELQEEMMVKDKIRIAFKARLDPDQPVPGAEEILEDAEFKNFLARHPIGEERLREIIEDIRADLDAQREVAREAHRIIKKRKGAEGGEKAA